MTETILCSNDIHTSIAQNAKNHIISQLKKRLDEECGEINGIECVTCEDIDKIFLEISV
jgi:Mlc titration factor MtfA (ptsG expression regulator)